MRSQTAQFHPVIRSTRRDNITSQGNPIVEYTFAAKSYLFKSKTPPSGLSRLDKAGRLHVAKNSLQYVRRLDDFPLVEVSELWRDTGTGSFTDDKVYVVQTGTKTVQRCILMTTDPGDPSTGSNLRLRNHVLRSRAVGTPMDYYRHFPRGPGSGALSCDGGRAIRTTSLPTANQAGRRKQNSPRPFRTRVPRAVTSGKASCMSECPTSN